MKMFFIKLFTYMLRFGAIHGVLIFIRLQSGSAGALKVPGLSDTVFVRKRTSDTQVFEQIFVNREYEFQLKFQPLIIIDLGANVGFSAVFFATSFPTAQIIALEPEKSNYQMLVKNTEKYSSVIPVNKAIWHKSTEMEVSDKYNQGEWGMIVEERIVSGQKTETVINSVTIQELMSEYGLDRIDILKIDIESAEFQLFQNNYELWLSRTKVIMIELHDSIKAGCSRTFFTAINNTIADYSMYTMGENVVIVNNSI